MRTKLTLLLLVVLCTCVRAQDSEAYQKLAEVAIIEQKVMVPMRDGKRLATDVYRPKGDGKYPIVFSRTPTR
jgi:predicted acyl esterase